MLKNNHFYINNLDKIIILGTHQDIKQLLDVNNLLGIKTTIITTTSQSKQMNLKSNCYKFDKIDKRFENFIKKNFDVKKTLFISISARYIFKKKTISNLFNNNLINFHGSRLPLDAGGGGYSWRILREDRIDTQLCHVINDRIDNGQILFHETSLFPNYCKIPIDFEKYHNKNFISFYKKVIQKIMKGKVKLIDQPEYSGRYNPRLYSKTDGAIDWDLNPHDLFNFINAFDDPYEGAFTYLDNGNFGKLNLKSVHLHAGDSSNHPFMSGIVSRHDKNWIVVCTKSKYMLLIEKVINKNKKNIINKIKVGDRFHTPLNKIMIARKKRNFFNSKGLKKN